MYLNMHVYYREVNFWKLKVNMYFLLQAFSRYQMQQITTEFMDTFGLDEDEFQEPDESIT